MKKALVLFFLIFSIFVLPSLVFNTDQLISPVRADTADVEIDLSEYLTLSDGQRVSEVFDTPASMVNLLVRVIFVGVGIILFGMIVISGLAMVAGGTSESKDKAKTTMTSALIGFLVIFSAYWIIQIIQVFTGADIGF